MTRPPTPTSRSEPPGNPSSSEFKLLTLSIYHPDTGILVLTVAELIGFGDSENINWNRIISGNLCIIHISSPSHLLAMAPFLSVRAVDLFLNVPVKYRTPLSGSAGTWQILEVDAAFDTKHA